MSFAINCAGTHKRTTFKITVFIFEEHPSLMVLVFLSLFSQREREREREMVVEENRLGLVECMMRINISFL